MLQRLALFAVFFLIASTIIAQTSNQGTVYGTITDQTHAVVPAAELTIVNEATGLTRTGKSNASGEYRFDFLPPGKYRLTATRNGFRPVTVTDITLEVGQSRSVNAQLLVGGATEQVSVSATENTIDTQTATRGDVIDSKTISEMPLNGREFLALATLVPGSVEGSRPNDNPVAAKAGYVVAYNGARGSENSYYMDGAKNTSPEFNNMISSPSIDAIQEFRVETNMYSPRYGQAGGAIISVVTKSGGNAFHGTLYEYHRDKALDALPYYTTGTRKDAPNSLWNQFGGSLGGPIVKNKVFFFVNSEYFRHLHNQYMISFAPTDLERVGNVSQSVNPWAPGAPVVLTDPYTGQVIPSGILPSQYITPIGQKLMSLWPKPNYPSDPYFNYRVFRPAQDSIFKLTPRVDVNLSSRSSLSFTFNLGNSDVGLPGIVDTADKVFSQHDRLLAVNYTNTIRPNLLNTLGVSGYQYFSGDHFRLDGTNYGVAWGLDPSVNVNKGAPNILFFTEGFSTFSYGNNGDNKNFNRALEAHDDVSWVKGSHTFQFGGSVQGQRYNWQQDSGSMLYYMNLEDGAPGLPFSLFGVTGSGFTNLLSTLYPMAVVYGGGGQYAHFQRDTYALYFNDVWRVNQRFTLDLGVRWEYERPFDSLDGKFMYLDPATGLVQYPQNAPGLTGLKYKYESNGPSLVYEGHPHAFMPRLGFAWTPFAGGNTVVRGGYGIFFLSEPAYVMQFSSYANPFGSATTVWEKGLIGGYPDGDHLTTMDKPPYGLSQAKNQNPGIGYVATQYNAPRGYDEQWNLTIGQRLPRAVTAEIAYVGSQSINLTGYQALDSYDPTLAAKVSANYPGWSTAIRTKGFNANYHGLQLRAKKETGALTFLASYTWSKTMAEASNVTEPDNVVNYYNDQLSKSVYRRFWSLAGQDIRQRLSMATTYSLPFGRGRMFGNSWNTAVDKVLGGWNITGLYTAQSGFPFSVMTPGNLYPDRICNGNLPSGQRTPQKWFDYSCFVTHIDPVTGAPSNGNAHSDIIEGPGINNVDLGILKQVKFAESKSVEFRAEFFNAFNHPQFKSSTSTSNSFLNTAEGAQLATTYDPRAIQLSLRFSF